MNDEQCAIEQKRKALADITSIWIDAPVSRSWDMVAVILSKESRSLARQAKLALRAAEEYVLLASIAAERAKERP